jgi:phosphoenolpyruvate synthase/pyruvate phosphate dikinase
VEFGAEGIGLCRTEHMFFAQDRLPHMQRMIMACRDTQDPKEAAMYQKERRAALAKLLPMQRKDFYGLFKAMNGLPVTIRTLDPPLHEFLPKREELMVEIATLEATKKRSPKISGLKKILEVVNELHEFNPMLALRGCSLGIMYPEITEMQVRAIFEAACDCKKKNIEAKPEVMIPLVGDVKELIAQKEIVTRVAAEVFKKKGTEVEYLVGTMIELPAAALSAGEIAQEAEFFSFGTNDLTQTTFGISRDLRLGEDLAGGPVCPARSEARGAPAEAGHQGRPRGPRKVEGGNLRRTWWRSFLDRDLRRGGTQLRELLTLPRAHRAAGGCPSGGEEAGEGLLERLAWRQGQAQGRYPVPGLPGCE